MKENLKVEYPYSLANSLKLNSQEFISEIKTSSMVKLFELGKVSSGIAAKVLEITRLDFLDLLAKYKVSTFGKDDIDDLNQDIANA
ncbi:MAG: UPF0175 family protein [Polaribacter sp.]